MKQKMLILCMGVMLGVALMSGGGAMAAAQLIAAPSAQRFYVDGTEVELEAYVINGNNYVKLRDVGRAVDFGVAYDGATNSVQVNSAGPYVEESPASTPSPTAPAGVIKVPQSDAPFRPMEGDVILLDDGSTFMVTKPKSEEPPLPAPACDWSQFPALELPQVQAKRGQTGVYMITNLYELRRMQYTIYNCVPNCPELWEGGKLRLSLKGNPILRLQLGITEDTAIQVFWPWRDDQLTQVFYSAPDAGFAVAAWDYYNKEGEFMFTQYYLQGK